MNRESFFFCANHSISLFEKKSNHKKMLSFFIFLSLIKNYETTENTVTKVSKSVEYGVSIGIELILALISIISFFAFRSSFSGVKISNFEEEILSSVDGMNKSESAQKEEKLEDLSSEVPQHNSDQDELSIHEL